MFVMLVSKPQAVRVTAQVGLNPDGKIQMPDKVSKPQAVRVTAQVNFMVLLMIKVWYRVSKPQAVRVTAQVLDRIRKGIDEIAGKFQNRKR